MQEKPTEWDTISDSIVDVGVTIDLTISTTMAIPIRLFFYGSHQSHATSVNCVLNSTPIPKPLSVTMEWNTIKNNHRMVKLYTGCSSGKISNFIVDHVRQKHRKLQYCKRCEIIE